MGQQILFASSEVIVAEAFSVLGVARLGEVVHVKLAYETRKVVVLEVSWKHFFSKLVCLVNDKGSAWHIPTDSLFIGLVL